MSHNDDNTPYSNRELDDKFRGLHEKLDLILKQTTAHNGRMGKLERWRTGIAMCIGLIVFLTPFFVWSFKTSQSNLESQVVATIEHDRNNNTK